MTRGGLPGAGRSVGGTFRSPCQAITRAYSPIASMGRSRPPPNFPSPPPRKIKKKKPRSASRALKNLCEPRSQLMPMSRTLLIVDHARSFSGLREEPARTRLREKRRTRFGSASCGPVGERFSSVAVLALFGGQALKTSRPARSGGSPPQVTRAASFGGRCDARASRANTSSGRRRRGGTALPVLHSSQGPRSGGWLGAAK